MERVSEIDSDLQKRDAYTLSFLGEHFTRRREQDLTPIKPTRPF